MTSSPIPPPVPVAGSLGAERLRERIRVLMEKSWPHTQGDDAFRVFDAADYDALRHAVTDLLEFHSAS